MREPKSSPISIGIDAYMEKYKGFMMEYLKDPGHRLANKIKAFSMESYAVEFYEVGLLDLSSNVEALRYY